jgi:hypothetical protein
MRVLWTASRTAEESTLEAASRSPSILRCKSNADSDVGSDIRNLRGKIGAGIVHDRSKQFEELHSSMAKLLYF